MKVSTLMGWTSVGVALVGAWACCGGIATDDWIYLPVALACVWVAGLMFIGSLIVEVKGE
jgi:hypothetical protein